MMVDSTLVNGNGTVSDSGGNRVVAEDEAFSLLEGDSDILK